MLITECGEGGSLWSVKVRDFLLVLVKLMSFDNGVSSEVVK